MDVVLWIKFYSLNGFLKKETIKLDNYRQKRKRTKSAILAVWKNNQAGGTNEGNTYFGYWGIQNWSCAGWKGCNGLYCDNMRRRGVLRILPDETLEEWYWNPLPAYYSRSGWDIDREFLGILVEADPGSLFVIWNCRCGNYWCWRLLVLRIVHPM